MKSEHITFRDYKHGGFLLCDVWDYWNAYRSESQGEGDKETGLTSTKRFETFRGGEMKMYVP